MALRSNVSACGTSVASEKSEAMEKVNATTEGGEVASRELGEQINPSQRSQQLLQDWQGLPKPQGGPFVPCSSCSSH
jgi:hypothetical protein